MGAAVPLLVWLTQVENQKNKTKQQQQQKPVRDLGEKKVSEGTVGIYSQQEMDEDFFSIDNLDLEEASSQGTSAL